MKPPQPLLPFFQAFILLFLPTEKNTGPDIGGVHILWLNSLETYKSILNSLQQPFISVGQLKHRMISVVILKISYAKH